MYNNNRSNKANDRPRSKLVRVALCDYGADRNGNRYDFDEMMDLLDTVGDAFKLISVPVFMSRADLAGDKELKGNTRIGFVRSYNPEKMEFEISVTGYNVEKAEPLIKNMRILPSVIVRDRHLICITSLDLCSSDACEQVYAGTDEDVE